MARKEGIPPGKVKLHPGEKIFAVEIGRLRRAFPFIGSESYAEKWGHLVVVHVDPYGEDLGRLAGLWENPDRNIMGNIVRVADGSDIKKMQQNREDDEHCKHIFIECIKEHKLEMKLLDIEHSLNRKKTTFYYEAEGRVDFSKVVRILAGKLKRRVEFYQLSFKDKFFFYPAYGPCGRRLCCQLDKSWFDRKIPSRAMRVQRIIYNPDKMAGPCGKPRCCLLFEADAYEEFYEYFGKAKSCCFRPKPDTKLPDDIAFCSGCLFKVIDWHMPLNKVVLEEVREEEEKEQAVSASADAKSAPPSRAKNGANEHYPEAKTFELSFDLFKEMFEKLDG